MTRPILWLIAALAPVTLYAKPAPAPSVQRGQAVFGKWCAPCHGAGRGDDGAPMLPGTAALAARYKGAVPAALQSRRDLPAEALQVFVRGGIGAMPMFRRAEVSDADIAAIAAYLRFTSAGARR
ncbi:c-type cytochrome [Novosphingobium sp. FSY-8]|uniref:C-type cytochrome n=1 Tax=Novosphingobium ovatum TaxID=1908523 RepID=A0ABW9XAW4_9SPHN|nr:cytochrome c [Novosphingobium ovatum]NBC35642.1 c-type cytochrome [Novosphingobium ovatum]